ncbi:programmed cell death protein 2 [Cyclospora cayetanensis]|uniref:Programmed cell death protein 2 n=1 Tax=Cyclospora cayetanensis TaxID=88456 RepID=A0A6P6RXQ5_9EIME|nr:programmed cell death protein 2 [Cyclospora cayetanensis]
MGNEPPVLIGLFSNRVPDDDKTGAEALSKFGGRPVWIDGKAPDGYPFACAICGADLDFVCQVATPYCANKRCLYLFGCHKQASCGKTAEGWRILRGVAVPSASGATASASAPVGVQCPSIREAQQLSRAADPSDWLAAAFGAPTVDAHSCDVASQRSTSSQGPKPRVSTPAPALAAECSETCGDSDGLLPPFFVHVDEEPPDNSQLDATGLRARELQLQYEQRSGNMEAEAYEESPDKVFLKLQKRLGRSPLQVIRYSFGGKPLFISPLSEGKEAAGGPCPQCGADRVFEMQLVPAAADEILKRRHPTCASVPVEWGIVAVFTCKEDCIPSSTYTREHAVVQEIL